MFGLRRWRRPAPQRSRQRRRRHPQRGTDTTRVERPSSTSPLFLYSETLLESTPLRRSVHARQPQNCGSRANRPISRWLSGNNVARKIINLYALEPPRESTPILPPGIFGNFDTRFWLRNITRTRARLKICRGIAGGHCI